MVTSATQTTTTHAQWIPEVWAAAVVKAVEFDCVINARVDHRYERDLRTQGDTVNITTLSNMTAQTKTSGLANVVNYEAITETVQQVAVTNQYYCAMLTEHPPEVQSMHNFDLYTAKMGYALNRKMETDESALFASFAYGTGTLGSEPSEDDLLYCWQILGQNGAPDGDRTIFITYAGYAGLLKLDKFINRNYVTQGTAIERAKVGTIYNFDVLLSNLLTANGAGYDGAAIHREQVIAIQQAKPNVNRHYEPDNLGWKVTADELFITAHADRPPETAGGGAMADQWGIWLKTN